MSTFDTFDDLLTSNFTGSFSQLDIAPNFSVGGLAYDGQYRLLVESNNDRFGGSEIYMSNFDTFDDLLTSNFTGSFSQLDIAPNFSVGGLAYDGQYRLLVESNNDRFGGSEIYMSTFDTFDDLLTSNFTGSFSQLDIAPNFSVGGLADNGFLPAPAVVPLPASLPLSIGAFGLLALSGAKRRRLAA